MIGPTGGIFIPIPVAAQTENTYADFHQLQGCDYFKNVNVSCLLNAYILGTTKTTK